MIVAAHLPENISSAPATFRIFEKLVSMGDLEAVSSKLPLGGDMVPSITATVTFGFLTRGLMAMTLQPETLRTTGCKKINK